MVRRACARSSARSRGRRCGRRLSRFTRTSAGTASTLNFSASSGCSSTSTRIDRAARVRSFRARWASRLSIRRAGPERSDREEDEQWLGSSLTLFPPQDRVRGGAGPIVPGKRPVKLHWLANGKLVLDRCVRGARRCGRRLRSPRLLAGSRAALAAALVARRGCRRRIGLALGQWGEAIGGGAGGALGAVGAAQLVARDAAGAAARGSAPRSSSALAAVVLAALAWIPVVGYLGAALVPPPAPARGCAPALRDCATQESATARIACVRSRNDRSTQ